MADHGFVCGSTLRERNPFPEGVMATIHVQIRPNDGAWQWRVLDRRGQLRLGGTHPTREEALETGRFWLAQLEEPEG
jgi:hypothetical protein